MNKYVVVFYNRFLNEIQTYKTTADNEGDAKEKFYERYPSSAYGDDCIETIETISKKEKKLELNNDELKRIAEKWYLTLGMGMGTGKSELDIILFNKIRCHLDKQEI
ncbi:hypothetical protein [Bacillus cereus group sp. BfR-BA-01328]|uniref:hypothetical protein n=1 Tax=Bacillus cereus group sp. BfR-BA-01328 TaxID=2920304 RepID=UPI001F55C35E